MSVNNNKLQVATQTSGHQATTQGPTDVCLDVTKTTPAPYDNYNPTSHLSPGTSKTFIEGAPIWSMAHILAAPSLPAHDGKGGGVVSGTYIDQSAPTMCSPDCKAEGDGVIRSTDTTTQNKANTTGMVTVMTAEQKQQMEADLVAGLDKLVKVEGVCPDGRVLDVPRGGQRTGELLYLEILNEEEVIFVATRENAIHGGGPECRPGTHTLWRVSRSGMADLEQTGDSLTLPADFSKIEGFERKKEEKDKDLGDFEIPLLNGEGGEYKGPFGAAHDQDDVGARQEHDENRRRENLRQTTQEERAQAREDLRNMPRPQVDVGNPPQAPGRNPSRQQRRQYNRAMERYQERRAQAERRVRENQRQQRYAEAQRRADERANQMRDEYNRRVARNTALVQTGVTILKNFPLMRRLWNAHHNPPEIHVTATACSGSKMAILKVFPAGENTFDLFSDAISTTLEAFRRVALGAKSACQLLKADFTYEFLVDPRLTLRLEYKELFEDGKDGLTKGCVNLAWELEATFEKFVYGFLEWSWPLELALSGVPALGIVLQVIKWASRFFGKNLEAKAYIKVEIDWKLGVLVVCNEYNDLFATLITGLKIEFQIGAKVSWDAANEVGVCAFLEVSAEIDRMRQSRDKLAELHAKGAVKFGLKFWVHVDFWFVRHNIDTAITLAEMSLGDRWFQFPPTG